jgi:hypothetical protein
LWTLTGQTAAAGIVRAGDLSGPDSLYGNGTRPEYTGSSVLTIDSSGTVTERTVLDGKPVGLGRRGVPVGPAVQYSAYEGKLYVVYDDGLSTVDLGGSGPDATYRVAYPQMRAIRPCGRQAVCFLQGSVSRGEDAFVEDGHVVMIRGQEVVARVAVRLTNDLEPAGTALISLGYYGSLYDADLRPLLADSDERTVLRLDDRTVLVLDPDGFSHTSVRVLDTMTRQASDLGTANVMGPLVTDGTWLFGISSHELKVYAFG